MEETVVHDDNLVLWGHSLADYQEMFDLTEADLQKRILDCFGGPASFNAECHELGYNVVSIDDIFSRGHPNLENHIIDIFQSMLSKVRHHEECFVWDSVHSVDNLASQRQAGINKFLRDFEQGKAEERYFSGKLHVLPFADFSFELALCSHYLFGERAVEDVSVHTADILEMCRVAHEVRIFPLLDSHGDISPLVGPVMLALQQENMGVELRQVNYQFQKNGNAMLRVWAQECQLD